MNVEREYSVVGTWEHTNETLSVLEAYIPRYFADASKMYYCKFMWEKSLKSRKCLETEKFPDFKNTLFFIIFRSLEI